MAELNIYMTPEPGLIQPILDQYTMSTGVTVNTVFLENGVAERVLAEGESSPADILMTVDFGNLIDLVTQGVTQPAGSDALDAAVPEALRRSRGQLVRAVRPRPLALCREEPRPDGVHLRAAR